MERALALDNSNVPAALAVAENMLETGRTEEAAQTLETLELRKPRAPEQPDMEKMDQESMMRYISEQNTYQTGMRQYQQVQEQLGRAYIGIAEKSPGTPEGDAALDKAVVRLRETGETGQALDLLRNARDQAEENNRPFRRKEVVQQINRIIDRNAVKVYSREIRAAEQITELETPKLAEDPAANYGDLLRVAQSYRMLGNEAESRAWYGRAVDAARKQVPQAERERALKNLEYNYNAYEDRLDSIKADNRARALSWEVESIRRTHGASSLTGNKLPQLRHLARDYEQKETDLIRDLVMPVITRHFIDDYLSMKKKSVAGAINSAVNKAVDEIGNAFGLSSEERAYLKSVFDVGRVAGTINPYLVNEIGDSARDMAGEINRLINENNPGLVIIDIDTVVDAEGNIDDVLWVDLVRGIARNGSTGIVLVNHNKDNEERLAAVYDRLAADVPESVDRVETLNIYETSEMQGKMDQVLEKYSEIYEKPITIEDVFFMISALNAGFYAAFEGAVRLVLGRTERIELSDADRAALGALGLDVEELKNVEVLFEEVIVNTERKERLLKVVAETGVMG
jgi:hypothetical protein